MTFFESFFSEALGYLERHPAEAARLRRLLGGEPSAKDGWIPVGSTTLPRKALRRLIRTGQVAGRLVGGRWYVSRSSLEAHLALVDGPAESAPSDDERLRAELGLRRAS